MLLQGIIFTFIFIFQCSPVAYAWTHWAWDSTGAGKCLNFGLGALIQSVVNIVLDFAIFALPVTQLWNMNLSKKKKLQVMSMFGVGFA